MTRDMGPCVDCGKLTRSHEVVRGNVKDVRLLGGAIITVADQKGYLCHTCFQLREQKKQETEKTHETPEDTRPQGSS